MNPISDCKQGKIGERGNRLVGRSQIFARYRRTSRAALATFLALASAAVLVFPKDAFAASYYGPPYKINYYGDLQSFQSYGDAANYLYGKMMGGCSSPTCAVVKNYRSPNQGSLAGVAAVVSYTTGTVSFYVEATEYPYDVFKNTGGVSCKSGNGEPSLESLPKKSSGNAANDAQEKCPSPLEGDPINTSTGNKFQQDTDYRGTEWLTFRRFYNSKSTVKSTSLGVQWRHSFDRSLETMRSTASGGGNWLVLYRPDGSREQFQKVNGVWTPDAGIVDTVAEQDDTAGTPTGYTVFMTARREFEQYSADGLLRSITDKNGLITTLTYSTAGTPAGVAPKPGLLISVTDPQGRSLGLTYDVNARISAVGTPDGGTLAYAYDANANLTSVTFPDSSIRRFIYNEAALTSGANLPNALTGVVDEKGVRFENTGYDSTGRAISSSFVGGVDAFSVTYASSSINGAIPATIKTPLGTTSTLTFQNYRGENKVAGVSASCGAGCTQPWKSISYDANGWPATVIDFNNNVTASTYSASGLETQRIEAKGSTLQRTVNTTWDTVLRNPLTRSTLDAAGNLAAYQSFAYNSRGQVTASCEADPSVPGATGYACGSTSSAPSGVRQRTYSYCEAAAGNGCPYVGLLLSATDPRGNTTRYSYYQSSSTQGCGTPGAACYQAGDIYQIIDPYGRPVLFASYDGNGYATRIVDANGVATDLTYTARGWVSTRTIAGAKTTYGYDKVGAVTSITDADGIVVSYTYDDAHRLIKITDALGNTIRYTLDAAGNRTAETTYAAGAGAPSRMLTRKFNALGQLAQELDAQNRAISFTYDSNGNLTDVKDRLNVITHNGYDALGRVNSTTQNYNGTDIATKNAQSVFSYNPRGELQGVSDPDGLNTTYDHDGLSNATAVHSPDTGTSSYLYDAAGNRIQTTDAKGVTSNSVYDALNRVTAVTYPDSASNVSYRYDEADGITGCPGSYPVGRLTSVVETAVTTVYCYDARGNIVQKRQTQGANVDIISYSYTLADRLASTRTPDGTFTQYARDAVGHISAIAILLPGASSSNNVVTNVSYLPFGPIASYTLGNGQTITRTYDANYALTDVVSPALNLHFARDAIGNITALGSVSGANPAVETYSYDPLYRLTAVKNAQGLAIEAYTYDKTGDRLSKAPAGLGAETYVYQAGTHRLISIGSGARANDANGNTTESAGSGGIFDYSYDDRNRMIVAQLNGQTVATYTYNARGQRTAKTTALPTSLSQRFVYDENSQLVGEYGNSVRGYVWLDSVPVAVLDIQNGVSALSYIHADGLNTPRAVTDSAGTMVWQQSYQGNPFGELPPVSTDGYILNLRFPGQYFDAESRLSQNGRRDYDLGSGRYLQADPSGLQGGMGLYLYGQNNPLSFVDPLGLCPSDSEVERCRKVKLEALDSCWRTSLIRRGDADRFWKCVNDYIEDHGCGPGGRPWPEPLPEPTPEPAPKPKPKRWVFSSPCTDPVECSTH